MLFCKKKGKCTPLTDEQIDARAALIIVLVAVLGVYYGLSRMPW